MNPLYTLNKVLIKIELENEIIVATLNNGLRLYVQPDKGIYPVVKYVNPQMFGKISNYKYYGSFLLMICEQYKDACYERLGKLAKDETVVDIGANIGIFTSKAAKAVEGKGKTAIADYRKSRGFYTQLNPPCISC